MGVAWNLSLLTSEHCACGRGKVGCPWAVPLQGSSEGYVRDPELYISPLLCTASFHKHHLDRCP